MFMYIQIYRYTGIYIDYIDIYVNICTYIRIYVHVCILTRSLFPFFLTHFLFFSRFFFPLTLFLSLNHTITFCFLFSHKHTNTHVHSLLLCICICTYAHIYGCTQCTLVI